MTIKRTITRRVAGTLWVGVACVALCAPVGSMAWAPTMATRLMQGPVAYLPVEDGEPIALDPPLRLSVRPAEVEPKPASEPAPVADSVVAGEVVALADLDEMRGGFEAESGLRIAFGIERAVWVNGQLVATTGLNVVAGDKGLAAVQNTLGSGGLRIFTGGGTGGESMNLGVIQVGPNNVAAVVSPNIPGTLIQNAANNVQIQNITTLNAVVNSAALLRTQTMFRNLRESMISGFRR